MKIVNCKDIEEKDGVKLYYAGSQRLSHKIISSGINPINTYINRKNGKIINVFVHCKELDEILTIWTNNKPKVSK